MRDSIGDIQSVLVLGGGSEIALAIVQRLVERRARRVVLAARRPEELAETSSALGASGASVEVAHFDADDPDAHQSFMAEVFGAGDIDLVILAFGVLGQPFDIAQDPSDVAAVARTNFVGGVSSATAAARQLASQGHGTLCVLSSVAGERVRSDNALYGSTKAGLDGFAQGLDDALVGTGARVMIVRPGFVHTKMTQGMEPAPFATTPDRVADDVVRGLQRGRRVVWSPPALRYVFSGLRHAPHIVWRRVSSR